MVVSLAKGECGRKDRGPQEEDKVKTEDGHMAGVTPGLLTTTASCEVARKDSLPQVSERAAADVLISKSWSLELWGSKFVLHYAA